MPNEDVVNNIFWTIVTPRNSLIFYTEKCIKFIIITSKTDYLLVSLVEQEVRL